MDGFEVHRIPQADDSEAMPEPIWADVDRYDRQRAGLATFCRALSRIARIEMPANIVSIVRDSSAERNIVLDRIGPGQWFGADMKTWAAVAACLNEGLYGERARWVRVYDLLIWAGLPIWRYVETDRTVVAMGGTGRTVHTASEVRLPVSTCGLRFQRTPRAVAIDKGSPAWRPTPHPGQKITASLVERIESDLIDGIDPEDIAIKHEVEDNVVAGVVIGGPDEIDVEKQWITTRMGGNRG